jgi:hypothetical protein
MIQLLMAEGAPYVIPGNSGILTSSGSYTLPVTSGTNIKILVIAGGGGGGSGRSSYSGFFTGGGGGGAGANSYVSNISVSPGQTISFTIGGYGGAGAFRDGIYSSGSNGGNGGDTYVTVGGSNVVYAGGGYGGLVSPNASGGSAGGVSIGSQLLTPISGSTAGTNTQQGGTGANGYTINTTVGTATSSILGYGNPGYTYTQPQNTASQTGTIYGAGGGGGGTAQSDAQPYQNIFSASGSSGAVFIWWGY